MCEFEQNLTHRTNLTMRPVVARCGTTSSSTSRRPCPSSRRASQARARAWIPRCCACCNTRFPKKFGAFCGLSFWVCETATWSGITRSFATNNMESQRIRCRWSRRICAAWRSPVRNIDRCCDSSSILDVIWWPIDFDLSPRFPDGICAGHAFLRVHSSQDFLGGRSVLRFYPRSTLRDRLRRRSSSFYHPNTMTFFSKASTQISFLSQLF